MLVREDGSIVGTVGGGAGEGAVIREAKEALASGRPKLVSFDLHENPRMDLGMVCGGSLNVFIEVIRPAPVAYLFGAGHVGCLTAQAARLARIQVEVIDDRPEFANKERFPDARAIHAGETEATLAALKPNSHSLVFIATRGHASDARALRWAVDTPAAYIGMIGSRRKVQFVYGKLKLDGVTDEQFARVHAPVGLDIGAVTPEEIAISVVAEMVATIRKSDAARPAMRNMREVAAATERKISQSKSGGRDAGPEIKLLARRRGRPDRRRGIKTLKERRHEANATECERRRPLGRRRKDRHPRRRLARAAAADRLQGLLQRRPMRHVHGDRRRQAGSAACLTPMEKLAPGAKITTIEGIGTPGQPASAAGCLDGARRRAVRRLHAGLHHVGQGAARQATIADPRRRCAPGSTSQPQPLPLHRLQAAGRRGDGCGRRSCAAKRRRKTCCPSRRTNGSILGTHYQRPSALAKVTGTWDFGADVALRMPPDTLRLALVQAEVSHANIKGIDTTEAEKMPGVAKVITWKDVKGKNAITGLITFPTNKGDGWDRPILCKEKVFQFGDAIAIVAADTEEHARAAAEKVKVDLEVLPAYMSGYAAHGARRHRDSSRRAQRVLRAGRGEGRRHQAADGEGEGVGRDRHLLQPPAPSASGAGLRHAPTSKTTAADHPVQEHRRCICIMP